MFIVPSNGIVTVSNKTNSSGDASQTETDGTLLFLGAATVWDDLRVPLY